MTFHVGGKRLASTVLDTWRILQLGFGNSHSLRPNLPASLWVLEAEEPTNLDGRRLQWRSG